MILRIILFLVALSSFSENALGFEPKCYTFSRSVAVLSPDGGRWIEHESELGFDDSRLIEEPVGAFQARRVVSAAEVETKIASGWMPISSMKWVASGRGRAEFKVQGRSVVVRHPEHGDEGRIDVYRHQNRWVFLMTFVNPLLAHKSQTCGALLDFTIPWVISTDVMQTMSDDALNQHIAQESKKWVWEWDSIRRR